MVTDSVAGGLFGGPGWADRVAATASRLVQTKRRFIVFISVRKNLAGSLSPDASIVAPLPPPRKAEGRCQRGAGYAILHYKAETRRFLDAFQWY
jgi:hypothetical protein